MGSDPELRSMIVSALPPFRVVGQTPQDPSFRNDMRPAEIAEFLVRLEVFQKSPASWAVIDDMNLVRQAEALSKTRKDFRRLMPQLKQRFVRTDKHTGLDDAAAAQLVQLLC